MVADLNLARAKLTSLALHTTLYGIYIILFILSLYALFTRQRARKRIQKPERLRWTLLTASILLFVLINTHWLLQLLYAFAYFTNKTGMIPQIRFHIYVTNPLYIASTIILFCESLLADMMMLIRLYHVWGGSRRVVILPAITFLMTIASAGMVLVNLLQMAGFGNSFFVASLPWAVTCCALELSTNFIITAFIAYRILSVERRVRSAGLRGAGVTPVLTIIVESAVIFTSVMTIVLVSFLAENSSIQLVAMDSMGPAVGIAFSLIIIRVSLGSTSSRHSPSTVISGLRFGSDIRPTSHSASHEHGPSVADDAGSDLSDDLESARTLSRY